MPLLDAAVLSPEEHQVHAVKSRETLLGLLALAIVLGSVAWVRWVQRSGPSGSAEHLGGPWEPWQARSGADADATAPDITLADGVVALGDLRVTLSVAPRPPVAFAKRFYRVRVESQGAAAKLEDGRISFEMKMPMGDHRYALVPGAEDWQEAVVVLPLCGSGDPRWYALVEGTVAGRPLTARFRLNLSRPGPAPPS